MTDPVRTIILRKLRNTRDLRAEVLALAVELAAGDAAVARLELSDPLIAEATIRREWAALLPALAPELHDRLHLAISRAEVGPGGRGPQTRSEALPVEKPNYLFEVLRLLLGTALEGGGVAMEDGIAARIGGTQSGLAEALGTSMTPVRTALTSLRDAGLIRRMTSLSIEPEELSAELLARLGALPQRLRFRYGRGARIRSPAELLGRAEALLTAEGPAAWARFALSGAAVAQVETPTLDLIGTPRLALLAHVARGERHFDAAVMRLLDDGLEPEPNILAPAPVVVTLVRAGARFDRFDAATSTRRAHACDVFLALLDQGLRAQALHYARTMRS